MIRPFGPLHSGFGLGILEHNEECGTYEDRAVQSLRGFDRKMQARVNGPNLAHR